MLLMPRIEPVPMEFVAPDVREKLEEIVASGKTASTDFYQILAYHTPTVRARVAAPPTSHGEGLLGPRLIELLRLRSAQLGGCEKCAGIVYGGVIDENDAACMISGNDDAFTEREQLALQYMTLMHTDHHKIDSDCYAKLHTEFTTAEIIELAMYCSLAVGAHRLVHTLDLLGTDPPAIPFDPSQIS
jgi:alkylhydroperoxidase family enzyme